MKYCALASGSNGNSYYISKGSDAVLIDIGVSCKQIEKRMNNLDLCPSSVRAVFVTHEHSDHIRGLMVFAKRYQVPLYMTRGTYQGSKLDLPPHLLHIIENNSFIEIGQLQVQAFPKYHDAIEPCSFTVSDGQSNIGVLTDIGKACPNVIDAVRNTEVLILEANYDEDMLFNGRYPYFLKQRIAGDFGHLSNAHSLDLFINHRSHRLKHVILSHLSGQNNSEEKVYEAFAPYCGNVQLDIASRERETALFEVSRLSMSFKVESCL